MRFGRFRRTRKGFQDSEKIEEGKGDPTSYQHFNGPNKNIFFITFITYVNASKNLWGSMENLRVGGKKG